MNMTKQAATMTQTVSAATPAAEVAVVSSAAKAETGTRAESKATPEARKIAVERRESELGKDVTSTI